MPKFLIVGAILLGFLAPASAEDAKQSTTCTSIERVAKQVSESDGVFAHLRVVPPESLDLAISIFKAHSGAEDEDWSFAMLLDAPKAGGGLILAGYPGRICKYMIVPDDIWDDLAKVIAGREASAN